jgi:alkylhydroperoxidase family enzyme
VDAVLTDHRSAPIDEKLTALFSFVEAVNRASNQIGPDDVERAKKAGWSEAALYDAVTVTALFNFYNVWIDATGVADLPDEAYRNSGKRLANQGYVLPSEREDADSE